MSTKIQSEPLYARLIAVIMTIALAMSSIGVALALPDSVETNESNYDIEFTPEGEHQGCSITLMDSRIIISIEKEEIVYCFGNVYINDEHVVKYFDVLDEDGIDLAENDYKIVLDVNELNLKVGDIIKVEDTRYWGNHWKHSCSWEITSITDSSQSVDSDAAVSFSLNFRASGIQATGFKDYKEVFAALNG